MSETFMNFLLCNLILASSKNSCQHKPLKWAGHALEHNGLHPSHSRRELGQGRDLGSPIDVLHLDMYEKNFVRKGGQAK
ncbi:hypothetical protein BT96DRAFT_514971 [Gymnopus androsaceus JB14]|uniref:Uncharacterized protein n=1 Tax=Gymnopus androsaceus JB14 TaxID=1447944 RepID=A0A6A4HWL1_9AGAR|nr:hypothetical protein BT96DRAFT_514971 [Gymnopus androsaceus JB14]